MTTRKPFSVPLVAVGPGSQPAEAEPSYLPMPQGMRTFSMPILPEPEDFGDAPAVRRLVERVCDLFALALDGAPGGTVDLRTLDEASIKLLNQVLGEGEVAAIVAGAERVEIQETVFAGVWRVCHFDPEGLLVNDSLEVGAAPALLRIAAEAHAAAEPSTPEGLPGVMNAPGVVAEIAGSLPKFRDHGRVHIINLSLLPGTPEDTTYLDQALGSGPVTILSRGYGNCRITSTGVRNVWRVQFFNSQDALILDTIEVTAVPEAMLAATQDFEDSRERLVELLQFIDNP